MVTLSSPWLSPLLSLLSFALVGAITPGPVNVLALRHGQQQRLGQALVYVLGASLSYALIVWCMGQSLRELIHQWPMLVRLAQWLCAAYLLWLAWRLATAPVHTGPADLATQSQPTGGAGARAWRLFAQGAAVQTLNPKAWLFALSVAGVFAWPSGPFSLYTVCSLCLLACLVGVGFWALLGKALQRWLNSTARQQGFHRLLALILVASVVSMLA